LDQIQLGIGLRFQRILKDFLIIKKFCGIQSRLLQKLEKSCGIQLRQLRFFFNATKFLGIQLRFLTTFKMSIDIQKSTDFDGFFFGMDFKRLYG
jgi:hypothetical protein